MTTPTPTKKEPWPYLLSTAVSLLQHVTQRNDGPLMLLCLNLVDFTDWRDLPDSLKDVKDALEQFYAKWASGNTELGSPQFKDFVTTLHQDIQTAEDHWHE